MFPLRTANQSLVTIRLSASVKQFIVINVHKSVIYGDTKVA